MYTTCTHLSFQLSDIGNSDIGQCEFVGHFLDWRSSQTELFTWLMQLV